MYNILLYTKLTNLIVVLALHNLARTYEAGGKYDEAIKAYEESLLLKRQLDDCNLVDMSTSMYITMHRFLIFVLYMLKYLKYGY